MKTIKLGLVGCGTVGTGLIEILKTHTKDFANKLGVSLELAKVTSRTKERILAAGVSEDKICFSYKDIIDDPEIDIVVELIGGTTAAYDVCMDALNAGKHVVTANKALVSTKGKELFHAAEANQTEIAFEASVGGGIPIIETLKHSLTGKKKKKVVG
ncbi:MAG: Gfo/Idh/MocA family oxidoreductase, partial [Coriobacteriales bacterium]|nr:Gfo/Idh/MocA family oxidoreductase [Coriobacteriales bacterium]